MEFVLIEWYVSTLGLYLLYMVYTMRTNTLLTPYKQGAVLSRYFKTIELAAAGCDETRELNSR